jgi:hypothetical protein
MCTLAMGPCMLGIHAHAPRFKKKKVKIEKKKEERMLIAEIKIVFKALCYKPEGRGFDTR